MVWIYFKKLCNPFDRFLANLSNFRRRDGKTCSENIKFRFFPCFQLVSSSLIYIRIQKLHKCGIAYTNSSFFSFKVFVHKISKQTQWNQYFSYTNINTQFVPHTRSIYTHSCSLLARFSYNRFVTVYWFLCALFFFFAFGMISNSWSAIHVYIITLSCGF